MIKRIRYLRKIARFEGRQNPSKGLMSEVLINSRRLSMEYDSMNVFGQSGGMKFDEKRIVHTISGINLQSYKLNTGICLLYKRNSRFNRRAKT